MYKLYPDCIPVKGFARSAIYNLFSNQCVYIPNILYDLLCGYDTTDEWYREVEPNNHFIIDEYIDHLVHEQCLYHVNDIPSDLAPLEYTWDTPEDISILHIEILHSMSYKESDLINYLNKIRVQNLVINAASLVLSDEILALLQETYVINVNIYLPYCNQDTLQFDHLVEKYPFITKIILTGAQDDTSYSLDSSDQVTVHHLREYKTDPAERNISFVMNKKFFFEAHSSNCFYNKRLFIDTNGNVKSHYSGSPLADIKTMCFIEHKVDSAYWTIKKDDIEKCKDCEHRYMCYDPRLPVKTGEKTVYIGDCGYNPYKATWSKVDALN